MRGQSDRGDNRRRDDQEGRSHWKRHSQEDYNDTVDYNERLNLHQANCDEPEWRRRGVVWNEQSLHVAVNTSAICSVLDGAASAKLVEELNELWVSRRSFRARLHLHPPHTEASVLIQNWQTHCARSLFLYQLRSLVDTHE
ncbi:unnamed protein product [Pleuronectes platessa]|uniref:Uncharacterized protein n=1 Tax=Pleuronectes platessa TaxID=8262 RepID=A0A9N7V3J7_PLEPL|nr:unnamed protein product [Pleuronectes platessa]